MSLMASVFWRIASAAWCRQDGEASEVNAAGGCAAGKAPVAANGAGGCAFGSSPETA